MRTLRNTDPTLIRKITVRTIESRLWMTPNSRIRKLIGGIVARYQELCGIEIFAYNFLTNHPHLLIRAPRQNTDEFCENVLREISRRINWLHHREGPLWGRRYTDQEVLQIEDVEGNDEELQNAFLYVVTNPTHHGLVERSADWPGLNCIKHLLNERDRRFTFYYYSDLTNPKRHHSLKLSVLPIFAHMTKKKRAQHIAKIIKEREDEIAVKRKAEGKGFLGVEKLRAQVPGEKPKNTKTSPKGDFYSKRPKAIKIAKIRYSERKSAYKNASFHFRLGDLNYPFPEYSFKPPLHKVPRSKPFTPFKKVA